MVFDLVRKKRHHTMCDEYEEKFEEDGLENMNDGGGATEREREKDSVCVMM